ISIATVVIAAFAFVPWANKGATWWLVKGRVSCCHFMSVAEEAKFFRRISELRQEMVVAYDDKVDFIQELEVVPNIDAAVKTARFLKENLSNDDKRVQKLLNMEIEAGISSDQNGCFF
ncbi:hypothetical protein Tco_1000694, partial [Tanacetum coccineum]